MRFFIGLNSGTSMDGIDAALLDVETHTIISGITIPYSSHVRSLIETLISSPCQEMKFYREVDRKIGESFAQAALELLSLEPSYRKDITAIGSHGQTIFHEPLSPIPYTVQLGCPHTIAERTQITTVADFRTRDLIAGGQGAPLAPIYHAVLFQNEVKPFGVLNIGGIANLTFFHEDGHITGYDVGPGNCLMDAFSLKHLGVSFDKNGEWAKSGSFIPSLFGDLFRDAFFQASPPKSIDKGYFSLNWLKPHLKDKYSPQDIQRTLLELTVASIKSAIESEGINPKRLIICGGGVHNAALFLGIKEALKSTEVLSSETLGVDPDFIEAALFAFLAREALLGKAISLNKVTGSKHPIVLGAIYPVSSSKNSAKCG